MRLDLPSAAFMARYKPKAAPNAPAPRKRKRVRTVETRDAITGRSYRPRPNHPVVMTAIGLGRFTVGDVASASGATVQQARAIVYKMKLHGMVREVEASVTVPSTYERIDGLSFDGRATNPAKLTIAAMPIGTRFGWADLPGTLPVKANAVFQARQLGMIRRITFRRLFSTWEIVEAKP